MAYTPRNSGAQNNYRRQDSSSTSTSMKGEVKKALLSTGLFAPDEGSKTKAAATVRVKEAVTIPAGAYINLYENDRTDGKGPIFKLQIREAVKKS
jgi:hypothetical protein